MFNLEKLLSAVALTVLALFLIGAILFILYFVWLLGPYVWIPFYTLFVGLVYYFYKNG